MAQEKNVSTQIATAVVVAVAEGVFAVARSANTTRLLFGIIPGGPPPRRLLRCYYYCVILVGSVEGERSVGETVGWEGVQRMDVSGSTMLLA